MTPPPQPHAPARRRRSSTATEAQPNRAAGSVHRRRVQLPDGTSAKGTIYLRQPANGRGFVAHLRWRADGRSITRSLGRVTTPRRFPALSEAWNLARERDLVHDDEVPSSSWASSPE